MEKNVSLLKKISSKFSEETLKSILAQITGQASVDVLGWEFEPGSAKGDNYLSIIHRVTIYGTVNGTKTQVKVIIKSLPENEASKKTFRSAEFFENEINFYSKVIPELEVFLESKNQKDFISIPTCLQMYCDGNNDYLVLEDSRLEGFRNIRRAEIWKVEDIQVVFKTLARFHSVSFAYQDQHPSEFDKITTYLNETYFGEHQWNWFKDFFTDSVNLAKDTLSKEYAGIPEEQKFSKLSAKDIYDKAHSCIPFKATPTSAIIHGDSWPGNYMIRTMEATGERDVMFLDFQLARCASPIGDLSNFIYTTTDKEMRDKHFNNLLKYYHDQLSNYINLLGSDPQQIYPWDLFMKEVKKQFVLGLCFSLNGLPIHMTEEKFEIEDIGEREINVSKIFQMKPIESKEQRKRYADMIVHAIQLGCI